MPSLFKDLTNAAAELMRKADAGDAEAQFKFAWYLLKEPDMSFKKELSSDEVQRALYYLKLSAAQGYVAGMAAELIGSIYYEGKIVPVDYKEAKLWFNTALLKENPVAAYMLGECAYYGHEENVDFKKAAKCFIQAAPRYILALVRLGDMYMRGEYLPYDPAFAKEIFEFFIVEDEGFYEELGIHTGEYEEARERLDDIERNPPVPPSDLIEDTDEQLKIRNAIKEVMKSHMEES
jgi:TPR repeat protein